MAGYWVPLEECASKFNIDGGSNERTELTASARSISRHSAAKKDGTYDVAIIGSGCIGAAGALLRDHTEQCRRARRMVTEMSV